MIFTDIDKTQPHTVLMVTEPVRLACLSFAGLARGVYYMQGDFRPKITKVHDRRLLDAGLIALRFISDTEKPPEFSATYTPPPAPSAPPQVYETQPAPVVFADHGGEMKPGGASDMIIHVPVPTTPEPEPVVETGLVAIPVAPAPVVAAAPMDPEPVAAPPAAPMDPEGPVVVATSNPDTQLDAELLPEVAVESPVNSDNEPVVILDDKVEKVKKTRKPRKAKAIAQGDSASKLNAHDENSTSSDPLPSVEEGSGAQENSGTPEDSSPLA